MQKNRSGLQWYPRSLSSVQTEMTNISKTKNAIFLYFYLKGVLNKQQLFFMPYTL